MHPPEERIELPHAVQALEAEDNAPLDGDRAARQPGAAAANRQRRVRLVAPAHDRRDLLGGRREHDRVRRPDHSAPHEIGEVATLRLDERIRRDHIRESHATERTLGREQETTTSEGVT